MTSDGLYIYIYIEIYMTNDGLYISRFISQVMDYICQDLYDN